MSYPIGTWVILLPHPQMHPAEMAGYDGVVTGLWEHGYTVKLPWCVKELHCIPEILGAAYPCVREECTYASAVVGEACSWHLT